MPRLQLVLALLIGPGLVHAGPGVVPAPAKPDESPVEHGARPDPGHVRPGSPDGDAPSAAVGELQPRPPRRILGLPVNAVLIVSGVLVGLLIVAWIIMPSTRRRDRARGGGTYAGP